MPRRFLEGSATTWLPVAQKREASIVQIARDFHPSKSCLQRWLKRSEPFKPRSGSWSNVTSGRSGNENSSRQIGT